MFLENVFELSKGSHKKVMVVCDFQESEKCLGHVVRQYRHIHSNMDKNNGSYICFPCSRMRRRGRSAPNCKYKNIDDHLMDLIDSEEKAYLLGWIASDGWLKENGKIGIAVNTCDVGVLEVLRDFICSDLPIANCKQGAMKRLTICSAQWVKSIKEHLNLSFETGESYKKSYLVQMPVGISYSLKWCFLRGYFEGDGYIGKRPNGWIDGLSVSISSSSIAMRMMIITLCRSSNINIYMSSINVQLSGQYAARFLEKIYSRCNKRFVLKRKYNTYKRLKVELSRFWDRAAIADEVYLTALENLTIT